MMKHLYFILTVLAMTITVRVSARETINFNQGWKFALDSDSPANAEPGFDDSSWRVLDLPHDWAIEGDFDQSNPSGTGGGALPGGIGWYRKTFTISKKDQGQIFSIEFDGVYMNSSVYLNGHLLGTRPYGYISFSYDLTPYLNWDGENVIAVKVDNSDQPNSRWYSGCGIYRDVRIVKTNPVHVAQWGTYITTNNVDQANVFHVNSTNNTDQVTAVNINVTVNNESSVPTEINVYSTLLDANRKAVTMIADHMVASNGTNAIQQHIYMIEPHLWSVDDPYMYTMHTEIKQNGKTIDTYETPFGIRTIEFRADSGFWLNGEHVRINGVCNHHDLGCLGAATNERAIERQLQILKAMGCNGIRCSHNPPSPVLLDLCDRMGFLVMDEAFDMWRRRKTDRDYARFFDEWYERDLTDLVVRDRNHPSIVLWSIGNEVLEQWTDAKADTLSLEQANLILNMGHSADQLAQEGEMTVNSLITARLAGIIKELDPTRPVTAGCNEPSPGNHLFRS